MSGFVIHADSTVLEATAHENDLKPYNAVCTVVKRTTENTPFGLVETEIPMVYDMPCSVQIIRGEEYPLWDRMVYVRWSLLRCRKPVGVDIKNTWRIYYIGQRWEIIHLHDYRGLGLFLQIDLKWYDHYVDRYFNGEMATKGVMAGSLTIV